MYRHAHAHAHAHAHTQTHTHTHANTHTQTHTQTKALLETLHTPQQKMSEKNPMFTSPKKRFELIELPEKLLDHFLRSNKKATSIKVNSFLVSS